MKNIVIMESPAKANTVKGYLGTNYKVMASKGHVRDLPKSKLGVEVGDKFKTRYINIRGKGDLINELKKEAKNADNVYFATDPDREGETIAWHVAAVLGIEPENAKRISFNEITKAAVKNSIKIPKAIDMNVVDAQQARRIIDRLVGYQISPFLWKNVKSGLSAGRVQSVETRLIVEREEEIRNFTPEEYWTITAELKNGQNKNFEAKFFGDENGRITLSDKEETDKILSNLEGAKYTAKNIKKGMRYKNPSPPFTTSTLLQEANKKLGFQSNRTMKAAQELYEGINLSSSKGGVQGLITYMRTDSQRISAEAKEAAKEYITEKYGEKFYPETPKDYKTDKNAQDAHEAIRPSHLKDYDPETIKKSLGADQYKIYKLIWDRFLSSQMQSASLDTVNAEIEAGGHIFKASGYTMNFPGYLAVYEETADESEKKSDKDNFEDFDEKEKKLPELKEGEELGLNKLSHSQNFTQPPYRYTEAALIKVLKEQGIGRPSTYAPTLTTILQRGYVERDGKSLKPTALGEITTNVMKNNFSDIVNYGFTAKMEEDLDEIEEGKKDYISVLEKFYADFKKSLDEAEVNIGKEEIVVPETEIDYLCENCGKKLIVKNGRFGRFAACPSYPECKFTMRLDREGNVIKKEQQGQVQKTDIICELCGEFMVIRKGRFGNFYACSNYPKCKNTKPINVEMADASCPLCGGKLLQKRGKNKMYFYSCEKYPECKFSIWDLPLKEKCPKCGSLMLQKKGKDFVYCYDKNCGYQEKREMPEKPEKQEMAGGESEVE
ncbi:MAG: type I DNA topoisomerase [Oscillospiraceae bacterium]|nr:type I DNA topoisomerase [Oscillospiraceae bacterium]